MTPEELQELSTLPGFPESARDLIAVAGLDAAAALIAAWPGQEFPVPMHGGRRNAAGERRFAQLAEVVGEGAAERICRRFQGVVIDIPSCKQVKRRKEAADKRREMRQMFDRLTAPGSGYSGREAVFEIGIAFGVSSRHVECVIGSSD